MTTPSKVTLFALLAIPLTASSVRVYQTNSAGDQVDIIDPATNKVVQVVRDIEVPHGVAFSPDGTRAWISCEAENDVWAVDTKTAKLIRKIPLSGKPNNLAVSKDGKRVFISIREAPGAVDVVDTASMQKIKSIPVKGAVHNTYVTPDGKYAVAGSIDGKMMTVIDEQTLEPAWELPFDLGVRPTVLSCHRSRAALRRKVAHLRTASASPLTARRCGSTVRTPTQFLSTRCPI